MAINTPSSSIAAVVFVFAFEACFTWGWCPIPSVTPPTKERSLTYDLRLDGNRLDLSA